MTSPIIPAPEHVAAVRRFSRFYTQRLGLLDRELLASGLTLTESRVLWELAQRSPLTARQLHGELGLDAGYMSRLLRRLREAGLLRSRPSPDDARAQWLSLSAKGRRAVAALEDASREQVTRLIGGLPAPAQHQLVAALDTTRVLLAPDAAAAEVLLQPPGPGDIGWIVQRHGALYAQEYGWDWRFEALVARIASDFVEHFQPGREQAWIPRRDGVNLGCVALVQAPQAEHGDGVAQLRLLLVEPAARGLGLGERLVAQCEQFAAAAGYRKMVLWTNALLTAAGAIYQRRGWTLVKEEPHHSFGHDMVGQIWEKSLPGADTPPTPAQARPKRASSGSATPASAKPLARSRQESQAPQGSPPSPGS